MNCSATTAPVVRRRAARGAWLHAGLGIALCTIAAGCAQGASLAELDDVAARIQYAFYSGDARSLEETLRLLQGFEVEARLAAIKSYQLAYGHWKLSQLRLEPGAPGAQHGGKSAASQAAGSCVRYAREASSQDASFGEAYALETICAAFSPGARHGTSGCARSRTLRKAAAQAPENPRIQLIEALCAANAPAEPDAAERWRAVVASFEAAPPSRPGQPDWGHVEALTLLGETYLQRGEPVAARDALERALVLAPDYRLAQQLLQAASARPK